MLISAAVTVLLCAFAHANDTELHGAKGSNPGEKLLRQHIGLFRFNNSALLLQPCNVTILLSIFKNIQQI